LGLLLLISGFTDLLNVKINMHYQIVLIKEVSVGAFMFEGRGDDFHRLLSLARRNITLS
jgi:hypothetical protein